MSGKKLIDALLAKRYELPVHAGLAMRARRYGADMICIDGCRDVFYWR